MTAGLARPAHRAFDARPHSRLAFGRSLHAPAPCKANGLWKSQRRSRKAQAYLQAYRLRQRLGGSRPVLDPMPERPYRMKRKTYGRILARIEQLERPLIGSRAVRQAPKWIAPLTY